MKIVNRILYRRVKKAEENDQNNYSDRDKKIIEQARSFVKKGKHDDVFKNTRFTDAETTAEELESIIYYGAVAGDVNFKKRDTSQYYDRYVDGAIEKQLYRYLYKRARWEQHNYLIDFKNTDEGECYCLIPSSLDIQDFDFKNLTDREIQVIIFYTYGFKDDYVSDVLKISINTVRTLRKRGLKKLRKNNNYQKLLDLSQPFMGN